MIRAMTTRQPRSATSPYGLLKTRRARRAPPSVAKAGSAVFSRLAKKTKYVDPNLADDWLSIAGPEIAALCRPGRITGMPGARTLELHTESSAAALQLQGQTDDLLSRLDGYFGPGVVTRISFRQTAGRRRAGSHTPQAAESVQDSGLQTALSSFRKAVARRGGSTPTHNKDE